MSDDRAQSAFSLIGGRIHSVRGQAVILDSDLAEVYGVETKRINEAVKRNSRRFTPMHSFQRNKNEWDILMSQIAASKIGGEPRGGRRKLPWVFSERVAVMLATVLNSDRAIAVSMAVGEAFVRLRHVMNSNRSLAIRIDELAEKVDLHDKTIAVIFHEHRNLVSGSSEPEPEHRKERIDFKSNSERGIPGGKNRKFIVQKQSITRQSKSDKTQ